MESAAEALRHQSLQEILQPVMLPLHSAFSNEWRRFIDEFATLEEPDAASHSCLVLKIDDAHIPMRLILVDADGVIVRLTFSFHASASWT